MNEYNFSDIEKSTQEYWRKNDTFKTIEDNTKENFIVFQCYPTQVVLYTWDM